MPSGKFFRLADVAAIKEGYADPPQPMFRFNGEPAIGLAISMAQGGNILAFGEAIQHKMAAITANLPIGIEPHLVADQPKVVEDVGRTISPSRCGKRSRSSSRSVF